MSLSIVILLNLYASLPFLGAIKPEVVWNDTPLDFWKVQNSDSGEYQLTISAEMEIVKDGHVSLCVRRIPGQYSTIYVYKDFDPPVDWSGYNYLEIWFYGQNTGDTLTLWLRSENDFEKRSLYEWSDHWVGWKRITISLQNPTYTSSVAGVNTSRIDMVGIDGLTQHFIGSGTLLMTGSYMPYIRGETLADRVFVYAAINVFGSTIFLFMLWFTFIKNDNLVKKGNDGNCHKQNPVELHGRHLPALNMLKMKRGESILDVGCSSGTFLLRLHQSGFRNLFGFDMDADRVYRSSRNLFVAVGSGLFIPFKDKTFNKVTMLEVLEHVPEHARLNVLHEIYRVLKPKGELVISVPTRSLFGNFDAGVWIGLHDSISLNKLAQLLQDSGFDLCEIYQAGGFWHILEMYLYARRFYFLRIFKLIK
jgi:SAM-dependent methyltransferase